MKENCSKKFNIQLAPVPMTELTEEVKTVREDKEKNGADDRYIKDTMVIKIKEEEVEMVAALALAMKSLVEKYGCQGSCDPVLECASDRNRNYAMCSKCDSQ